MKNITIAGRITRDAVTAFIEDYVRRNHKARSINGVRAVRQNANMDFMKITGGLSDG